MCKTLVNFKFTRFRSKDKSEHFHQICLLSCDNGTKIENVFNTRGVLRIKCPPKFGYISLKINIDTQFCFLYFTVVFLMDVLYQSISLQNTHDKIFKIFHYIALKNLVILCIH